MRARPPVRGQQLPGQLALCSHSASKPTNSTLVFGKREASGQGGPAGTSYARQVLREPSHLLWGQGLACISGSSQSSSVCFLVFSGRHGRQCLRSRERSAASQICHRGSVLSLISWSSSSGSSSSSSRQEQNVQLTYPANRTIETRSTYVPGTAVSTWNAR